MKEKLFSFGLLVCAIGFAYLIIALIRSAAPGRGREQSDYWNDTVDPEEEKPAAESTEEEPDTEVSDEDDEFLKSLLGDSKS